MSVIGRIALRAIGVRNPDSDLQAKAERLLGTDTNRPTPRGQEVPEPLVRHVHGLCMIAGCNTAIGYDIDDMRTWKGMYEQLDILKQSIADRQER